MDKPWKVILLIAGIFAAGSVAGGFFSFRWAKQHSDRQRAQSPDQWAGRRLGMLTDRLGLTPEQMERLRPILRRDMEDLNRIRSQSMTETRRIIDRMEKDIAQQLTPAQKEEYEKIKQKTAEGFRRMRMQQERARGGKGRPEGGGSDGPRRRPDRPSGEPGGPPPEQKPGEPKQPPGGG